MSIVLKPGPEAGRSVVSRALWDLQGIAPPHAEARGGAMDLSDPLPVYRLGLNQIDSPESLDLAEQVGWRYLMEGAGSSSFADVMEAGEGQVRFASLSRNANADRLVEAAALAQEIAEGRPAAYEARILETPALQASAIWLAAEDHVFIPFVDLDLLNGGRVRVREDFLDNLVDRARELRDLDERPQEERSR